MSTWTDSQIDRWMKDAEEDIVAQVSMRFESFSLPITSGVGTYTFNHRIYKIIGVTWKGKPLSPYIGRELDAIEPKFRELQGEPRAYQMSRDGISVIRLMPIPNESLSEYDSGLYSDNIENAFIIRALTFPDRTLDYFQIPSYLSRNLIKCYTLARAFHAEGPGQNLRAADFYQKRYMSLVDALRSTRANYYSTKERLNIDLEEHCQKKRLPRLPFGFVIRGHIFPLSAELVRSDLNNWNDNVDIDVVATILQLDQDLSDDINNWGDDVAQFSLGLYQQSPADDLNNWSDATSATATATGIPTDGLVIDYKILEGSGQTLTDSSGNGNSGTLGADSGSASNDPTWGTDGGETVLVLDGTSDYITVPNVSASFSGSGTLCIVLKLDNDPPLGVSQSGFVKFGTNGTNSDLYPLSSDQKIYCGALSNARKTVGTVGIAKNAWHVVFITSTSGAWEMFQNNASIFSTSTNTFGIPTAPFIGKSSPPGSDVFIDGMIARFCLYSKVLNSSERAQLYSAIKSEKPGLSLP